MGVGLSLYAVLVHRIGLLWLSCGFVNRLRSFLRNCRLVNLISSNLIYFSVLSIIPQGCDLWVSRYLLTSVLTLLHQVPRFCLLYTFSCFQLD